MKTHILLIDDDIDEMKIFVEALKEVVGTCKCTYAANGVHALKILLYLRPDVIFVKYNMPVMDGLQVAEEVKKIERLEDTPFFLYAKHMDVTIEEKARRQGIRGCLETPASVAGLSEMLKTVFPLEAATNFTKPIYNEKRYFNH